MGVKGIILGITLVVATILLVYLPFVLDKGTSWQEIYLADVLFREGVECLREGDLSRAERAFKEAIACQPFFALAHYNLAYVYERQGRFAEAIEEYHRTIVLDPEAYFAFYRAGSILAELGRYSDAVSYLRRAIELNPTRANFYKRLANIFLELGDAKSAEQVYEKMPRVE